MEPSSLPTMDTSDWRRTQLPSDLRRETINKIFERIKEQLPFSGANGTEMVRKFATEFEESVFTNATNQDDYIRQTTLKPLNMETESQNADGSSRSNNINMQPPLDLGNDNTNLPNEEPPAYDWRAQYPQDSRLKNIDRTMKIFMNRDPYALGQGEINELRKIAINFEQSSFYNAINQEDYQEILSDYIEAYNDL